MKTQINLLPWSFKRKLIVLHGLSRWAAMWAIVGGMGLAVYGYSISTLSGSEERLSIYQRKAKPLEKIASENKSIETQLARSDKRQLLLENLADLQQPLQLVGIISQSAKGSHGGVKVSSLSLEPFETTIVEPVKQTTNKRRRGAKPPTTKTIKVKSMKLALHGVAIDDLALSQFVARLREAGVFSKVELRDISNIQLTAGVARQYSVECVY
jgi:hypothetical protein